MAFERSLIAVVILAASMAAVASDTGPERTEDAASAQSSQSDEASRQVVITDRLAALLRPAGVAVVAGLEARKSAAFRQVQVHWEAPGGAASAANAQPASGALTVGQSTPGVGDLPRRRSLELAETEVLVIGVDAQSRLRWWHVMTDPRLLRAETAGASGELSGGVSYVPRVDFSIAYPDDPAIEELRVYHPQWTGTEFRLAPLGILSVR